MKLATHSAALSVQELSKSYDGRAVLSQISFTLNAGESLAVIGPSGCGKSTLLYLLAGLTKPDSGSITGSSDAARIAFLLQDYGLFPWKTVEENIRLPLDLAQQPRQSSLPQISAILKELGLDGMEQRYPAELSGGQRQRVALGRALINAPELLLLDEPLSSLDALTREHMQQLIMELRKRHNFSCVLVTHSVSEAIFLGQKIMVLGGSPAQKLLWLDNPCYGLQMGRKKNIASVSGHEEYFALSRAIYEALEGKEA